MRKFFIIITAFIVCGMTAFGQNKGTKKKTPVVPKVEQSCNLQGTVQYKHNDYIGYKIDVGSEIYVYPLEKFSQIYTLWQEYEKLVKYKMRYLEYKEYNISDANRRSLSSFSTEKEARLDSIESQLLSEYIKAKDEYVNLSLIDNSGKYSMSLPYGEYIVVFKSKNRTRPTLFELLGRLYFEKINANKPALLVSCDFDY